MPKRGESHSYAAIMVRHALMTAAEEWSGSPEQADDMTVIVAKLK